MCQMKSSCYEKIKRIKEQNRLEKKKMMKKIGAKKIHTVRIETTMYQITRSFILTKENVE